MSIDCRLIDGLCAGQLKHLRLSVSFVDHATTELAKNDLIVQTVGNCVRFMHPFAERCELNDRTRLRATPMQVTLTVEQVRC